MLKKLTAAALSITCIGMLIAAYYFQTKITDETVNEYALSLEQRNAEVDALETRLQDLQAILTEASDYNTEVGNQKVTLLNNIGTWKDFQSDFTTIQKISTNNFTEQTPNVNTESEVLSTLEYESEEDDVILAAPVFTTILMKGIESNFDKTFTDSEQDILKSYDIRPYDVTITVNGNYTEAMEIIESVLEKYYFTHMASTLEINNSYDTLTTNSIGVMEIQIKLYCKN